MLHKNIKRYGKLADLQPSFDKDKCFQKSFKKIDKKSLKTHLKNWNSLTVRFRQSY